MDRAQRMRAKRAGGFAAPATPDPRGTYLTMKVAGGGMEEFGYLEGTTLLVAVERPNGEVWFGILGENESGGARIETLTCGAFTFPLARIIGPIVGPLAEGVELDSEPRRTEVSEEREPETPPGVAELRARLRALDPDDITNSTARLKLEKEIYDLEHPRAGGADDWPEYIEWKEATRRALEGKVGADDER